MRQLVLARAILIEAAGLGLKVRKAAHRLLMPRFERREAMARIVRRIARTLASSSSVANGLTR